ncbi:hypothetical protein PVE_R2G0925 [Pseudomonas veronii 1YdBTEX2]|uniref:Uncharacterized protein n=1 Tax=Pseudomonas veronii 1YdBTEX2 TaxID=1295141 RepID=A0A1D3K9G8_PSEVE|nr:hypothetical protein PVE_R2G0925 [Pseudomonas veronii 1YdBTEX2]
MRGAVGSYRPYRDLAIIVSSAMTTNREKSFSFSQVNSRTAFCGIKGSIEKTDKIVLQGLPH